MKIVSSGMVGERNPRIVVQGATRPLNHCETHAGIDWVVNVPHTEVEGADICVDIHRISATSLSFPVERRVFVTTESPFYCPYFMDHRQVGLLEDHYAAVITGNCYMYSLKNAHRGCILDKWVCNRESPMDKKFGISAMFSGKRGLPNYELRWKMFDDKDKIRIPAWFAGQVGTKALFPLQCEWNMPSKDDAMGHMFHLAVENACSPGYFTEKLIDCFATWTVPVYVGDPEIENEFNLDGIIVVDQNNWLETINNLTENDWKRRLPAMIDNYTKSKKYWNIFDGLKSILTKISILPIGVKKWDAKDHPVCDFRLAV